MEDREWKMAANEPSRHSLTSVLHRHFRAVSARRRASLAAVQLTQSVFWISAPAAAELADMAIPAITSGAPGNQLPASLQNKSLKLQPTDFIKMMITQLQNQDPLQPSSSDQLLSQMSQIVQLQSSTQLQDSLKGLVLQNQTCATGSLIDK